MQRYSSFIKQCLIFFIPVILTGIIVEIATIRIPMSYDNIQQYVQSHSDEIEVIVLGSSQMQAAVNPAFIDRPAVSYASKSQHHTEDAHILKQKSKDFTALHTVVLELSYAHLEIPHNGTNFWKNNIYLKYYGVNAFERRTYFKDKFVFYSNPALYSKIGLDYYLFNKKEYDYNIYGYDENNFHGAFKQYNYDVNSIAKLKYKMHTTESPGIFNKNTAVLYEMLDYTQEHNLNVILCTVPLFDGYEKRMNKNILHRRDSILKVIQRRYPHVQLLLQEKDSAYLVTDFINHNHLNPNGGAKFSHILNDKINSIR